ncbi:effector-associated domain EAD1-containing protein [Chondromyces crocatus]|uniref:WD repeat-containing protein n=1 Tax=Chondromyces crocatus TaxID=52 RepID=A0A0K1EH32_CHOCO|nr:effector-associated domain EAD1-containing protein [Chondromyces crocatus]AKT39997.1 WD repeat-containing protein [Chondromyces crocatus]
MDGEIINFEEEQYRHERLFARQDVLDRLQGWLVGERALYRGWVFLLGGPGVGKSAILAELLKVLPEQTPRHFIRRGNEGWDRPEVMVQNLCAQIERLFSEPVDTSLPLDARLGDLLRRVSRKMLDPYKQRLVLVLDGLDEAVSDTAGKNPLPRFLPRVLPPGVVLLCASRPVHPDLDGLLQHDKVQRIDLDDGAWTASNEAACRAFWEHYAATFDPPLDATFVREAVRRAGGNLLHAIRLRDWLEDQPPERRIVKNIPKQLSGFLSQIWSELLKLDDARSTLVVTGLGVACAAREALPAYLFRELLEWSSSSEEEDFLRVTRPFLRQENAHWHPDCPAYRLYHEYFREFIVWQLGEPRIRELNRLLASTLAQWPSIAGTSSHRGYALRHAVTHRIEGGMLEEARTLCTNVVYMEEKCRGLGVAAVERDLEAVIRASGAEGSLDLATVLAALGAEASRLRASPALLPALLYNRLRCAGWSPDRIGTVLHFPAGLPSLRLRHGVRLGPTLLHTFVGHERPVSACGVTPDDGLLLSASADRTLRLWALGSGEPLAVLRGHEDEVTSCAITADGKMAVSSSVDATLRVWDLTAQRCLVSLEHEGRWVTACAVSPDGKRVVGGLDNGRITVWDRASRRLVGSLQGHADYVTACQVTADGKRVVSASRDRTVRVWDIASGACTHTLRREDVVGSKVPAEREEAGWMTALLLLHGGLQAVSVAGDGLVMRWDLGTGHCAQRFGAGQGRVDACALLHDGRHLVCGMADGSIHVWDLGGGRLLRRMDAAHGGPVSALSATRDGRRLVSASSDRGLKLWDLGGPEGLSARGRHTAPVAACAVTPDGRWAVSASEDRTLKIWDVRTGACRGTLPKHEALVTACAISADGQRVLSGASDGSVRLLRLGAKDAEPIRSHEALVSGAALLGDGRIVTASANGEIGIAVPATSEALVAFRGDFGPVVGCAMTPDGAHALTISREGPPVLWDLSTRAPRLVLSDATAVFLSCALSRNGDRTVLGREDGVVEVRDLVSGQVLHELRGHTSRVFGCAISPDETRVISASEDETLRVWSLESGECLGMVQGTSWFRCVAVGQGVICAGDQEGDLWMIASEKQESFLLPPKPPIPPAQPNPPGPEMPHPPKRLNQPIESGATATGIMVPPPEPPRQPPSSDPWNDSAMVLARLRDVLAKIYDSEVSARRLVMDVGLDERRILFIGTLQDIWHAILREAVKTDRVALLMEWVLGEYPENPALIDFKRRFFSHGRV